jgi:flagellar FliL protein
MADDKDIAEEAPGSGKKKLFIIIGAAVLLLVVAAAVAFFLLGGEEEAAGEEAAAEETIAAEEGDPVYHELDPIVANLSPGGSLGMLQIAIQVMTRTPTVVETLKTNDPMIRHHLVVLLEQQQADALMTKEGKETLQAAIMELLSGKLEELKEPGVIKGVYFTQFVMQ